MLASKPPRLEKGEKEKVKVNHKGRVMAMRKQRGWIVILVMALILSMCACKFQRGSNGDSAIGIIGGSDGPTAVLVGEDSEDATGGNVGTDTEQEEIFEETLPLQNNTYTPSEEVLKVLGRADFVEGTLWMVHSASGAEFQFVGTKAVITLQGDSSAYSGSGNQARVGIFVNGECVADVMMDKKEKSVTVWESEKRENCIVTVVKLSEAPHSTTELYPQNNLK